MEKKTKKGWDESNLDLDEYLTEPCEIDEDMMLYIQECVSPQYSTCEFGQGGDPIKHEYDEDGDPIGYFMTTSFINGKYFYLGILPEFRQ